MKRCKGPFFAVEFLDMTSSNVASMIYGGRTKAVELQQSMEYLHGWPSRVVSVSPWAMP